MQEINAHTAQERHGGMPYDVRAATTETLQDEAELLKEAIAKWRKVITDKKENSETELHRHVALLSLSCEIVCRELRRRTTAISKAELERANEEGSKW